MLVRRTLLFVAILAVALMTLAVTQAQISGSYERDRNERPVNMQISSYDDDPFVMDSVVELMGRSKFDRGEDGRPSLLSNAVWMEDEPIIYRRDQETGQFKAFALNPWSIELRQSNAAGNFRFQAEERFPLHRVERDADGKIVLRDGLQVWLPQDLHRGLTTTFEAVNAVKDAAESWSGRSLAWGDHGRLEINTHAFIDFNAFYSPSGKSLFFGVVPHRPPGEPGTAPVRMFETATSWEIAAHESGHALHHTLKPNIIMNDFGYRTWSESFGDQTAMWTSLRDWDRMRRLLVETNGDLNRSNALTRIGEALGGLIGRDVSLRDAFNEKKVSDTSPEIHARSEVLTGAAYKFFLTIFNELRGEHSDKDAIRMAERIMGRFLMCPADFTPENSMTLEDVAKAYLKVDKEFFNCRYQSVLVDEFMRREIFDVNSLGEWMEHEAAIPYLYLPQWASEKEVEELAQASLDKLGIGPEFGLKLQSLTRGRQGMTIVRVQLTSGRGDGAESLNNHGILAFRRDGILADYHGPLPLKESPQAEAQITRTIQLRSLFSQARQIRLDQHGAPLSIVRRPDGQLTVEARVLRGTALNPYLEVFSLDNPLGRRLEVVIPPVPPDKRISIPDDLIN